MVGSGTPDLDGQVKVGQLLVTAAALSTRGVSRRRLLLGGAVLALPPPAKATFDLLARNGGAASSSPYVAASSNGRYFVKNGSPWLMIADSAQTLVNIYGSDVTNYLSTRAS